MPFENVRLTAEQREQIAAMRIKNPFGSFRDIIEGIAPIELTLDKSNGNWLAHCYDHHDIAESISEFTFMYDSVPTAVQARLINKGNTAQSPHSLCAVLPKVWKIFPHGTDERTLCDERFRAAITEAFKVYFKTETVIL